MKTRGVLLVGVNKNINKKLNLRGPANDVQLILKSLKPIFHLDYKVLTNDKATYNNILEGLEWLKQYKVRIFFYSGHGSWLPRSNEEDGHSEILIPYDHTWDRPLSDDIIHEHLWPNTYCIFDACHSSGMSKDILQPKNPVETIKSIDPPANLFWDHAIKSVPSNVYEISACRSNELSLEKPFNGEWYGVLTWGLHYILKSKKFITLREMQRKLCEIVRTYSFQHPVVTPPALQIFGL